MLRVLNEHTARLQAPDTVIGFRLKDSRAATEQLGRLEEVLKDVLGRQPQLKDRLKRRQFAGGDFLVLELDGSLVPWDEVPWEKIETKEGEFAALQKKLKGLKLTISLGVKDRYLLLAIGAGTEGVTKLGQGAALAGRAELRPLAKYADRTVTAVAYSSAKMLSAFSTRPEDIDGMVEMADAALKQAPIADEQRAKLLKDLKALAQEWKSALPKPAAAMAFSLLTDRGQESFSYSYLAGAQAPDKPLTILDHLGGSPLLAAAGRTGDATPAYKGLVKWAKVFYGHFEEIVLPQLGEAEKEQFQAVTKVVFPLLKRFDEITGQQFLPSLADGQSALVIDARWTSRRWHTALPEAKKPLPMLELGCVHSVSDAELLTKALANYRQLINDSLDAARQLGARIPEEVTIPKAQSKKVAGGTLYWWPLPEAGQDPQVLPNLGIGERVMVVTLSEAHSQRLLKATPLQVDGGPLAQQRPLLGAAVVDFAGLVQAARPWVEDVALPEVLREVPEEGPPGLTRKEVPEQVRTVLEVLQCLRGMTSATYVEDGAVVTHSETVFRDLPAK
jgi:hypothetical protein